VSGKAKWYNTPWFLGVGVTVVGGLILSGILDLFKNVTITTTLKKTAFWTFYNLLAVLNYNAKVWWVIIALFVIYLIWFIFNKVNSPTEYDEVFIKPDWINYKKDKLKKWTWIWDYSYNNISKQYDIVNMRPYCESCKIAMIQNYGYAYYSCPKCDKEYPSPSGYWESESVVKALIIDKVDKEMY
jgi:hypothetical protein